MKRIWCSLFGHRFYTSVDDVTGEHGTFCLRCGRALAETVNGDSNA